MVSAGLAEAGVLEHAFDERLRLARARLNEGVASAVTDTLDGFLDRAGIAAERQWQGIGVDQDSVPSTFRQGRRPGAALVAEVAETDIEYPEEGDEPEDLTHVQKGILRIIDSRKAGLLSASFRTQGREQHAHRVEDLCDASQCHQWLWSLGRTKQQRLPHEEFVIAARLRLGASIIDSETSCKLCGAPIDLTCLHPLTCAIGEATKGHTRIKDAVMELALKADPAAESEPQALTSRPGLRPADILCSAAVRGSLAALDVGVTLPSAADGDVDSDSDAAQRYLNDKLYKYRRHLEAMRANGIVYKPIIWTAWGRAHPDAIAVLRSLAMKAARRRGLISSNELLADSRLGIALELQARAARMVMKCLPTQEDEATSDMGDP
jgi:hypothetical protein